MFKLLLPTEIYFLSVTGVPVSTFYALGVAEAIALSWLAFTGDLDRAATGGEALPT